MVNNECQTTSGEEGGTGGKTHLKSGGKRSRPIISRKIGCVCTGTGVGQGEIRLVGTSSGGLHKKREGEKEIPTDNPDTGRVGLGKTVLSISRSSRGACQRKGRVPRGFIRG